MKKFLIFSFAALALVFLGLAQTPLFPIFKYRFAPHYPENASKTLRLKNLKEKVTVVFDEFGVPHIEAKNLEDLVRATGFVQARYRGFQLDLLRKFAAGRLSEMLGDQKTLGSTTVEFDMAMKGWGFESRSKIDLASLPKKDQLILKSFTDGVNQGMKKYPAIEHEILGVNPEPWTYQDTLLVGLLQAWSITHNWEQEAVKFSLAMELGPELAQKLYPLEPLYDYGTLDDETPGAKLPPAAAPEAIAFLKEILAKNSPVNSTAPAGKLQTSLGDMMQVRPAASNAWVVAGALSDSGAPILHNDMHLTHALPSLIFLQHLKMPGLNVTGATMPGLPFMISGFNGKVAWGVTSAVADVVDLVMEKEDPSRPGFALNQTAKCPIQKLPVTVRVKDEEDRKFIIRKTCNGPLLNDMYPGFLPEGSPMMAIRLKLPKAQESFGHLLAANQAEDVYELRKALMKIPSPIQNVMAADMEGNIGFFATGSVPKRQGHRGVFPVPGWLSKYDWTGWMGEEEMPKGFNPSKGYFVNANNLEHNVYKNLPVFHVDAAPAHRFDRIKQRILELPKRDQASLQNIQTDNVLVRAKKLLPGLLEDLKGAKLSPSEIKAFNLLKKWNFKADADSNAGALFMALYRKMIHEALENKISESALYAFLKQRYSPNVADTWMLKSDHVAWDNPKTDRQEVRRAATVAAFKKARSELTEKFGKKLEAWKWGDLHNLEPTHPFGKKSVLSFFNLDKTPMAGGLDSVWKAHFNLNNYGDPFKVVAGPVYRFSIDLAAPEKARFGTDTGASGWPLSPHYGDQYEKWKKGELISLERNFDTLARSRKETIMELIP